MSPRPAIFLDRDGVIIEDAHYLASPEGVQLVAGSAEAIHALNRAGWPVIVVTNQAGVGRGLFPESAVDAVHARLRVLLTAYGARVDRFYYCPHHPAAELEGYRRECACRKPRPGMLRTAAVELGLDLARSWMIGDRETDLAAGAAVGARTVLVRTGYGAGVSTAALDRGRLNLELVAANLLDAVTKCGLAAGVRSAA